MRGDLFLLSQRDADSSDDEEGQHWQQPLLEGHAEQDDIAHSLLSQPHELLLDTILEEEEPAEYAERIRGTPTAAVPIHHQYSYHVSQQQPDHGRSGSGGGSGLPIYSHPHHNHYDVHVTTSAPKSSSLAGSYINLSKMLLGAGIMALPYAFSRLGLLLGCALVLLVAALTLFSLTVLVRASERSGKMSYSSLVGSEFGPRGAALTRICTVLCCGGYLVIYLVIIADTLVGNGDIPGLLDDLLPPRVEPDYYLEPSSSYPAAAAAPSGVSPASSSSSQPWQAVLPLLLGGGHGGADRGPPEWMFSRTFWLTVVVWVVLAPLVSLRHLRALSRVSMLGLLSAAAFVAITSVLALLALCKGKAAPDIRWLPDASSLSKGYSGLAAALVATARLAGCAPVVMTAFMAHFGIHPVMQDLDRYSPRRIDAVVRGAVGSACAAYLLAGAGGYVLFGGQTSGDVLADFGAEDLAPLVGFAAAQVLVVCVKSSYMLALLLTFPVVNWAVQSELCSLLASHAPMVPRGHMVVNLAILSVCWGASLVGASMWQIAVLLGSTTGTVLCFLLPGALELRCGCRRQEEGAPGAMTRAGRGRGWRRLAAAATVACGVAVAVAGCASVFVSKGV